MFYQSSKTARAAAIGTIMPWTGGIGNVPKGWIVCDGSVPAVDYPLLAQAIGDTYNKGSTTFFGSFPAYTGQIKLPDLNDKALMDIEQDYFGASAPRAIDRDITATSIISNFIGPITDNVGSGISNVFNDKYTDIIFDIPLTDRGGYQGKITGNTIIPGEAEKVVYVAPRKLSRNHLTLHEHRGSYPTIQLLPETTPGKGAIPYENVTITRFYTVVSDGGQGGLVYPGFTVNTFPNFGGQIDQGIQYPDEITNAKSGWGRGTPGRTVAGVSRESPPINFFLSQVTRSPLAGALSQPRITGPTTAGQVVTVPYGQGGTNITIPPYIKTYYNGPTYNILNSAFSAVGSTTRVTIQVPTTAGITNGKKGTIENHISTPYINGDITIESVVSNNTVTIILNQSFGTIVPGGATGKIIFDTGVVFNTFTNEGQDDMTKTVVIGGQDPTRVMPHDHDEIEISFVQGTTQPLSSINADVNLSPNLVLGNTENKGALQINFNTSQPSMTCLYIIRAY